MRALGFNPQVGGAVVYKFPPVPMNTLEMQKRASTYLRLGAEQALKLAEELYQVASPKKNLKKLQVNARRPTRQTRYAPK